MASTMLLRSASSELSSWSTRKTVSIWSFCTAACTFYKLEFYYDFFVMMRPTIFHPDLARGRTPLGVFPFQAPKCGYTFQQHPAYLSLCLPSKYKPGPTLLDFGDWMSTGMSSVARGRSPYCDFLTVLRQHTPLAWMKVMMYEHESAVWLCSSKGNVSRMSREERVTWWSSCFIVASLVPLRPRGSRFWTDLFFCRLVCR